MTSIFTFPSPVVKSIINFQNYDPGTLYKTPGSMVQPRLPFGFQYIPRCVPESTCFLMF